MILLNGMYFACGKASDVKNKKTGINSKFFITKDAKKNRPNPCGTDFWGPFMALFWTICPELCP
jgi:hypothetical protein